MPDEASAWVHDQRIGAALDDASTQDAVTLAEYVHESGHRAPHLGADEVLAAYHHWGETELKGWFSATQEPRHGYRRALLLAVAALEGAPVGRVFSAAERLCEAVGIDHDAAVLAGLAELVTQPRLRARSVAEVVKWAESGGRGQAAATEAFLHLSGLRSANGSLVLVPESTREAPLITT